MGFGMSTIKYILFIFNVLCALLGIAVIAAGGVLLNMFIQFKDHGNDITWYSIPIAIIVLGILIFTIAFFGCCGAIRESHCMTITYSVFLCILMVLQIILCIFVFLANAASKDIIGDIIEQVWKENTPSNTSGMDFFQETFHCCGRNGKIDYYGTVPASCHVDGNINKSMFESGCKQKVTDEISKHILIVGYVGIGVFVVELLGFIFACCLANNIRNNKRRSTY